jgi:hypothetical protein
MNEIVYLKENKMNKIVALVLACILTCMVMTTGSANDDRSTVTVTGEASLKVKNDEAVLRLGVVTKAQSAKEAAAANAKIMTDVKKAIIHMGVPADKIETQRYDVEYKKDDTPVRTYETGNAFRVKVQDTEKAGQIIDAAVSAGVNRIDSIVFIAKNVNAAKEEALKRAIENAKEKAKIMAEALGKRIVNVVSIEENSVSYVPRYASRSASMLLAAKEAVTPLEGGESTVQATVTIVFEIA